MVAPRRLLCILAPLFHANLCGQASGDRLPSTQQAFDHAIAVVLAGNTSEVVDKRVGPIRVIATTHDSGSQELINRVVGEVNGAFGYGKLALSWSDNARLEDDAVTIYVGPRKTGIELVERFGVSSPRGFRSSTYYYWWDEQRRNHIRRCLIAMDHLLPKDRQLEDLRYLLLACMGFKSPWSAKQLQRPPRPADTGQTPAFSKLDNAIIRFFDKHVNPGAKAWEMRAVFKSQWPDFSAAYYNPQTEHETNRPNEDGSQRAP